MAVRRVSAQEDQSASFVELFFDLVFVYALTQVSTLLLADVSAGGALQAALVLWLVWWAWTQFSWALNAADTTHPGIRFLTLVSGGVAFFMAQALPDAFGDGGLWFVVPYVAVRLLGLGLYGWVAADQQERRSAVRSFALLSLAGLAAALLGGALSTPWRGLLWAATLALDLWAALRSRYGSGWGLFPSHFAERHGLFVIVALGESLIAAGLATAGAARTPQFVAVSVLAVATTCGLWWTYFGWAKEAVEAAVRVTPEPAASGLARDAYSLLHFPLVGGVIGVAVAVEESVAHPHEALPGGTLVALGLGVVLFVGAMALIVRRVGRPLPLARCVLVALLLVVLALLSAAPAMWCLAAVAACLATVAVVEAAGPWAQPQAPQASTRAGA